MLKYVIVVLGLMFPTGLIPLFGEETENDLGEITSKRSSVSCYFSWITNANQDSVGLSGIMGITCCAES